MPNKEILQTHSIESSREELLKKFEKIKERLSNPLVYKDSKGEKILLTKKGNEICMYKARDANKDVKLLGPYLRNAKSKYALIKNGNGSFSLKTETYTVDIDRISHRELRDKFDNLNLEQISDCLKNFETRINEAEAFVQEEKDKQNEEKYKRMQQYAYKQEDQDKMDANNLINGLDGSLG